MKWQWIVICSIDFWTAWYFPPPKWLWVILEDRTQQQWSETLDEVSYAVVFIKYCKHSDYSATEEKKRHLEFSQRHGKWFMIQTCTSTFKPLVVFSSGHTKSLRNLNARKTVSWSMLSWQQGGQMDLQRSSSSTMDMCWKKKCER